MSLSRNSCTLMSNAHLTGNNMLTRVRLFRMGRNTAARISVGLHDSRARVAMGNGFGSRSGFVLLPDGRRIDLLDRANHNCFMANVVNMNRRPAGRTLGSVTGITRMFRG